jgi:SAM-dependent methyltransferase
MSLPITMESEAELLFELAWQSEDATHLERYLARRANIWRDCFPPGVKEELLGRSPSEKVALDYSPGEALPPEAPRGKRRIAYRAFRRDKLGNSARHPKQGRFYPKGLLENLAGIHPQNVFPFRVLQAGEEDMFVDLGHPLHDFPVRLTVTVVDSARREGDTGGKCTDWRGQISDMGPGMQAALDGMQADFSDPLDYSRQDETDDASFYQTPRFVRHIDSQASELLQREYEAVLEPGSSVLDLMSSYESHLPLDKGLDATGLGMNSEEMAHNPALNRHVVHDVNAEPRLPFPEESFHAVLCSLSVEYMVQPVAVLRDVARVLKPGGRIGISFSNRWFPPKTIVLWPELYEFERLGYVLDLFRRTGVFDGLETVSRRNWWRPEDDKYYPSLLTSDPVYLAWARRGT